MNPTVTDNSNGNAGDERPPTAPPAPRRRRPASETKGEPVKARGGSTPASRARTPRAGAAAAASNRPLRATRTTPAQSPSPEPAAVDPVDDPIVDGSEALTPDEIDAVYDRSGAPARRGPLRPLRPLRLPVVVGVLVVVILAAALVFFVRQVQRQDSVNSLRSSALSAATTYGGYLASYDYQNLTGPTSAWSQVEKHTTASFKKDFSQTSGTLGKVLTQYNAKATGKVIATGLSSVSGSRSVVLLFIDQTVTNKVQKPNSVTQPLRVQLTMLRQHGQWFIDNLQLPS